MIDKFMTTRNLLILAALSFIPTLFFYTVGEEGIYTISSMEMAFNNNWLIQTLYGFDLHRPPLMNWLVIPLGDLLGWTHVLLATRTVSILATLGSAVWLFWLTKHLFKERTFALFTTLAFLAMADLTLYRGWLAYTDPLFSFFTFGAMATLWVGVLKQQRRLLLLSIMLVSCALLTKAFTAYVFYGTAGVVLLWSNAHRRFLLSRASIAIIAMALIAPAVWFTSTPQTGGHSNSMFGEIIQKLSAQDFPSYAEHFLIYPFDTALRLSPVVLLALYLLLRRRCNRAETAPSHFRETMLITLLCILPYWFSPQGGIRYLLPAYPFIALLCARLIWRANAQHLALRWFAGVLTFKLVFALVLFPYYQHSFRGQNYVTAAHEISRQTAQYPVYVNDPRSITENIVSEIDLRRMPKNSPLTKPPKDWGDGFLLAMEPDDNSQIFMELHVANDDLYLLCRGSACNATKVLSSNKF